MTPEEIIDAYNVVVQDINNVNAQEAARVGNAQRSLGTLAERVASPTGQTSGLANYTYNRTMRPVVEQAAASLTTTGIGNALENKLRNDLRAAKNRYEDAKNSYTVASTTPKTTGGNGDNTTEKTYDGGNTAQQQPYTKKGTILGTGNSGNGVYDVIVADGQGKSTTHSYFADSPEEAKKKYLNDYNLDGSRKDFSNRLENKGWGNNPLIKRLNQIKGGTTSG